MMLIHRDVYKIKPIQHRKPDSFELAYWHVTINNSVLNVCVIYRPPYSMKHKSTPAAFVGEFMDFMTRSVISRSNLVVGGDFNLHVNNSDDTDANELLDSMMALGFDQHVDFFTHTAGNTLDLLFTEIIIQTRLIRCTPGPTLSDHTAVEFAYMHATPGCETQDGDFQKTERTGRRHFV